MSHEPPKTSKTVLERYPTLEIPAAPKWKPRRWDAGTLSGVVGLFSMIIGFGMLKNIEIITLASNHLGFERYVLPELWGFIALILAGFLFQRISKIKIAALIISMFYWSSITISLLIVRPLEPMLSVYFAFATTVLTAVAFQRTFAVFWESKRNLERLKKNV
jgi:hypothetical protein